MYSRQGGRRNGEGKYQVKISTTFLFEAINTDALHNYELDCAKTPCGEGTSGAAEPLGRVRPIDLVEHEHVGTYRPHFICPLFYYAGSVQVPGAMSPVIFWMQ